MASSVVPRRLDNTGLYNHFAWVANANSGPDGKSVFSPAKLNLLRNAVYAACGEKLGVADAIIADPRACHFKPSTLQCRAGDAADCLTQAEVAAAEKIYSGPVNSRGQRLFPGVPPGSEPFWPARITGTGGGRRYHMPRVISGTWPSTRRPAHLIT